MKKDFSLSAVCYEKISVVLCFDICSKTSGTEYVAPAPDQGGEAVVCSIEIFGSGPGSANIIGQLLSFSDMKPAISCG